MGGDTRRVVVSEQPAQSASQLRHRLTGRIAGKDDARLLDDQRERAIRDALPIREGAPAQHASAFVLNLARQLEGQPGLADPGSAHDGDQLWIPLGGRPRPRAREELQLRLAPDKRGV
jgi:hypothetical protein